MRRAHVLAFFCLAVQGCLLPEELDGGNPDIHRRHLAESSTMPIGRGDRFARGELPVGIGQSPRANFDGILNVEEVDSALTNLAMAYPDRLRKSKFRLKTFENRPLVRVQMGRKPRVFLVSGLHARERGGPDILIYFISDLLWATSAGRGLTYDGRHYSPEQVRKAASAGIISTPLVNPDGVAYDQKTDSCWRKNRNTAQRFNDSSDPSIWDKSVGVDLNRNFATMFDYKRLFSPESSVFQITSDQPEQPVYKGPEAESETETKSLMYVLRAVKSLSWYLDLHSFGGHVLYSWGHDTAQTTDPRQSFANVAYDGQRGLVEHGYGEFMEEDQLAAQIDVSNRMVRAMNKVGGATNYSSLESARLPAQGLDAKKGYPAWGSTDEAMALYYGKHCGANRISGLTLEFGSRSNNVQCPFYPDAAIYRDNLGQTAAGLMEMLLMAADERSGPKVYRDATCCRYGVADRRGRRVC
ncbi:hypothetical protein CDD80_1069 [Ophiocordyceps camponoti-rufipedis]|uniref:Peptidase M14 domain-containing protein n=1 Tax=Ophiocordyceps camponoti-rufipedis TaxID=2004952 RepID=A0A2C5ZHQ4_9HYPO|nr:hypothetical protein CDD80_1069 [Ophiocordyceps camponoti-rufipedis]